VRPTIKPLTSFRFLAALVVVIFHYDRSHSLFPLTVADFGYEAVTFFFVLSGFILTYTHGLDEGLNVSRGEFAALRLTRVLPAYILALIVAFPFFLAGNLRIGLQSSFWLGVFTVPSMLQSWWPPAALLWNPPAWSLSNELFFYAIFPALWNLSRRLPPLILTIAAYTAVVAGSLVRSIIPENTIGWENFSAYFPLLNLPQFFLGVTLGRLFLRKGISPTSNAIFLVSILLVISVAALKGDFRWLASNASLCLVFGLLIYSLAGLEQQLRHLLSSRYLVILGEASYAIYILHLPIWLWWDRIVRVWANLQLPLIVDFLSYLVLVILSSLLVMAFVEKPARARVSKWLSR
jgi:peptidoglycan/LPS O-acetylase OafA/YrhL